MKYGEMLRQCERRLLRFGKHMNCAKLKAQDVHLVAFFARISYNTFDKPQTVTDQLPSQKHLNSTLVVSIVKTVVGLGKTIKTQHRI